MERAEGGNGDRRSRLDPNLFLPCADIADVLTAVRPPGTGMRTPVTTTTRITTATGTATGRGITTMIIMKGKGRR